MRDGGGGIERERESETQAEGEAGSMQGARCGTRPPGVFRIAPWAEGGAKPLSHPSCPSTQFFNGLLLCLGENFNSLTWSTKLFIIQSQSHSPPSSPATSSHICLLFQFFEHMKLFLDLGTFYTLLLWNSLLLSLCPANFYTSFKS